MNYSLFLRWALLLFAPVFVSGQQALPLVTPTNYLVQWNTTLTDAMVTDGFSPLLASRSYLYPNIAAYEALRCAHRFFLSLAGQVNQLDSLPQPEKNKAYYFDVVAITAFYTTGKEFIYREFECDTEYVHQLAFIQANNTIDPEVMQRSKTFGETLSRAVIKWGKGDAYNKTKAQPKYIISTLPDHWLPTPSDYRSALEPYWNILRTCGVKDKNALLRTFDIPYSTQKGTPFYNMVNETYTIGRGLTAEQKTIARYWDDNPDQMTLSGHNMMPRRQMSPTGHWIAIAADAILAKKLPVIEQAELFAMGSMAVFDGFICCWHQKYTTDLVRPVTYIRSLIDSSWEPLIITPPFPEYTSGHSTISAASAAVLTHFLGDNFAFTDSTVLKYNLPPRSFSSFNAAANEASVSRLYGGIHYTKSLDDGAAMGREIAEIILQRIKTRQ